MSNTKEILELKFEGNGINPTKVRPSEIAQIILDFEKAILGALGGAYPVVNTKEPLITFESIKNESIGLRFTTNRQAAPAAIRKLITKTYEKITSSIENGDYSSLPEETVSSLKSISKFARKYNCNAGFKRNGRQLTSITPKTEIKSNKNNFLKGDTTIYGELVDAGGDNPNIHIKINNDYTVIIDTDKKRAKELAARLYDQVGLKGSAKWDILTSKIIEFKLYDILDYSPGNLKETFDELKKITSGYWDKFNTNEEITNNLTGE